MSHKCPYCPNDHSETVDKLLEYNQIEADEIDVEMPLIHALSVLHDSRHQIDEMRDRLHRDKRLSATTFALLKVENIAQRAKFPFEVSDDDREMSRAVMMAALLLDYANKEI